MARVAPPPLRTTAARPQGPYQGRRQMPHQGSCRPQARRDRARMPRGPWMRHQRSLWSRRAQSGRRAAACGCARRSARPGARREARLGALRLSLGRGLRCKLRGALPVYFSIFLSSQLSGTVCGLHLMKCFYFLSSPHILKWSAASPRRHRVRTSVFVPGFFSRARGARRDGALPTRTSDKDLVTSYSTYLLVRSY